MIESWQENWQQRFRSIIQELGHRDTFSFVMSNSGQSFGKMFRIVRESAKYDDNRFLAFTHLSEMFYIDALKNGQFKAAIAESLARSIQQSFRKGWNKGKHVRERRIDIRTNWPIPSFAIINNWTYQDWRQFQTAVLKQISERNPPDNWCPANHDDEILKEVFSEVWPREM